MIQLFHTTSQNCSRVFNIYGFVRFADEIVDTFHDHDKEVLLEQFKKETYDAIQRGISLNPILNSFQRTVNEFNIDLKLVDAFFHSMEMDLSKKVYDCEKRIVRYFRRTGPFIRCSISKS